MIMNQNTIILNNLSIEIPKISADQYTLLRTVLGAIEKDKSTGNSYFIASSVFPDLSANKIKKLLKENVKFSLTDASINEWYATDVISEIRVSDDKIFFRPANILYEIVNESNNSSKHSYLKYILFSGIRYKQTLLFLDHIGKIKETSFSIELDNLKVLLEFDKKQYGNFSTFRSSVIDRIIKDINSRTTYSVNYETAKKKNATKIISILFTILKKSDDA